MGMRRTMMKVCSEDSAVGQIGSEVRKRKNICWTALDESEVRGKGGGGCRGEESDAGEKREENGFRRGRCERKVQKRKEVMKRMR